MKPLLAERAKRLLQAVQGRRVVVIGDVMLDEFLWGRAVRLSPEAPVPVVEVTRQGFLLGGAGNVAANVRALGGAAVLIGVVGRDVAGDRVREALAASAVESALVICTDGRPTTVKTRILAYHQQVARADHEQTGEIDGALEQRMIEQVREAAVHAEAIIVSDYQKGVVTADLMRTVIAQARRKGTPVLVDPKVPHLRRYRGASIVTPNQTETERAVGTPITSDRDLASAGRVLLQRLGCEAILITRGEHGMSLFPREGRAIHIATAAREVFDVTGAGDTVIATLGLALAGGARLSEAAQLANAAAGVVVGKLGTATASPEEVLATLASTA